MITPTISQSLKQTFETNFREEAQQCPSLFKMSSALKAIVMDGNIHNISRIGKAELTETLTRNPVKSYDDPDYDNRKFSMRRFTKTFIIDKKDAQAAIKDPTSDLYSVLVRASNRMQDRVIAEAATADVLMGDSNAAGTTVTAATDGVITVDATAGLTYSKILELKENLINNDVIYSDMYSNRLTLAITGTENTDLMNEDKFINQDFTANRPVDAGELPKVAGISVITFAGSKLGGIQVANPILDESISTDTLRNCLFLAAESIGFSLRVERFDFVEKVEAYVDSSSITVVLQANAIRLDGKLVEIVQTTV